MGVVGAGGQGWHVATSSGDKRGHVGKLIAVTEPAWTQKHEEEATFNDKKFLRAGIEAVMQNASLPTEAELLNAATLEHKRQRARRKRERQNTDNRRNKCFRTPDRVPFDGKHAYIAQEDLKQMSNANTALDSFLQMLCAHFTACRLSLADHPVQAAGGLFVVMDPAKPTLSVLLVAILTGGSVIDPLYLFARGSQGSNISYNAAVSVRRQIYASPGALARWPEEILFLRSITEVYQGAINRWKYLTVEPLATALAPSCLAIVSEEEKSSHVDWSTCRYALELRDFLDYVMKINEEQTSSGLCGH